MVARSGLFVAPVPGAPPVGTAPTDGRLALAGLYGTISQVERGGAITQSASVMQFTVAQAVWQLPDVTNASATFLSPTDLIVLTIAAGPATGSRMDAVVVKQNNYENGDADSRANVSVIAGTAGAPGVLPTIPAGYLLYATISVPTSAANAAACTVVVPQVVTSVAIRNAQFVNPVQGSQFWRNDLGRMETYFALYNLTSNPGGKVTPGWYQTAGNAEPASVTLGSGITVPSGYLTKLEKNGNIVTLAVAFTNSATTPTAALGSGTIFATLPAGFTPQGNNVIGFTGFNNSGLVTISYTIEPNGNLRAQPQVALGGGAILYGTASFSVS